MKSMVFIKKICNKNNFFSIDLQMFNSSSFKVFLTEKIFFESKFIFQKKYFGRIHKI